MKKQKLLVLILMGAVVVFSSAMCNSAQEAVEIHPTKTAAAEVKTDEFVSDPMARLDALFKDTTFEMCHMYTSRFLKRNAPGIRPVWNGKKIDANLLKEVNLSLGDSNITALETFWLGKGKQYQCFLVGYGDEIKRTVRLLMFDHELKLFTFMLDVASYQYMEGTMRERRNSWIAHLNEDRMLDIATINELTDYELPLESNISGTTQFKHLFRIDNLLYHWWGDGLPFEIKMYE